MKRLVHIGIALLLIVIVAPVFADSDDPDGDVAEVAEVAEVADDGTGIYRIGVIFNTPSILLEIDRYQKAGVGLKAVQGSRALRALFGLELTGSDQFSGTLGAAYEYHPVPGRVSPYVGGSLTLSYVKEEVGDTEWTDFGVSIGPIFGVEFTLVEGVAFFAEYILGFDAVHTSSGDEDTWNYLFATRLGNQGSVGVVVYFPGFRRRAGD